MTDAVFLTGSTGLVGNAVAARLLRERDVSIYALVRNPLAGARLVTQFGGAAGRVIPIVGDLHRRGLGVRPSERARLQRHVRTIIHGAADTAFSRPLDAARATNTRGTAHVLELAREWNLERFLHVSTAFVAGARTGAVVETALDDGAGFVNGYEQSKHEAEALVRASDLPWLIARCSTIVCADTTGVVTQLNAVHRALRVYHAGLAAMMPGTNDSPVDLVTMDHVAEGVVRLSRECGLPGGTYHLCAGSGALPLGELLDRAYAVWSRAAQWRRRGIARPALTDLATYRLFERSVEETGDVRLRAITRSLSHFVPQLALPKHFETKRADAALHCAAVPVRVFWDRVVEQLIATRWSAVERRAT